MNPLSSLFFPFAVAGFLVGTVVEQFRDGFTAAIRFHAWMKEGEV